ncbi:MAG: DNA methyltransferase [Neisseriales bacterium]|nr:MAG: DNA methyltransferase [Neisseriales bacterium]
MMASEKLSVKYENNKIYAPLKKKYLEAKPEEKVRQQFICDLVNDYGYSLDQMDQEVKLTYSQRGNGAARADLVIWRTATDKKKDKAAFMVLEFKADSIKLKVEDCYQGYNYATWSRAKLFAVSNGMELQVYKTVEDELPLKLTPVSEIPHADNIIDDKRLEKELNKTKAFKGDEFATLLKQCHDIIRNNDKLSPEAAFDEISKVLFIKIMYERDPKRKGKFTKVAFEALRDAWNLSKGKSETESSYMQRMFEDVKADYRQDHIFEDNEKIRIREGSFEEIVEKLQTYNLTKTGADVKGIAFETFLSNTFRGELGQFFTPRTVVEFMVDVLEPTQGELICDPCAGSGGFLIRVFEKIKEYIDNRYIKLKKEAESKIFDGFISLSEEELENLSESDRKQYEETEQKLVTQYEVELGQLNSKQEAEILQLSKQSIFGTDANPRMARVSKMNMIMHGDGHNGIHHNDGLLNVNGIFRNRFDVILTNPPFGSVLSKDNPKVAVEDKYTNEEMIEKYIKLYGDVYKEELEQVTANFGKSIRGLYETGKTTGATEVLFVERCLDLLKPGGRLGIVLPEGVLNSSNLQKVREYFESRAKILLIVSLPQDVFNSSGATVKTSLVFLKKFDIEEQEQYDEICIQAKLEVMTKYKAELDYIDSELAKKGQEKLTTVEKKKLQADRKLIENKIAEETLQLVKIRFDYQIPIAEIGDAGITTTGAQSKGNQLFSLLAEFKQYQQENKLW